MRVVACIAIMSAIWTTSSLSRAAEVLPHWLEHAYEEGYARPADIDDLNAIFLNEEFRREIRAQPAFCVMRLRPEIGVLETVIGPLGDDYTQIAERVHGAVVESERVCRESGVALGITQLLTDPDLYHVFSPPPPHLFCGGFEFAFEFETSLGQLDVLVLGGCGGIVTYWDGEQIAALPIAVQANHDKLRDAISAFFLPEGE